MGYYVTLEDAKLNANNLKELPEEVSDFWSIRRGRVKPEDYFFKWRGGEWFEEKLVTLAKLGVTGEVRMIGEGGAPFWKYVLEKGKVRVYDGEVVYKSTPRRVLD